MKYFLLTAILFAAKLQAQTSLTFNKRFVESEDRWVAFQPGKDSSYTYGFIYIDAQAGLTLNYEGTFTISPSGEFVPKKLDSTSLKVRLQPNKVLVAFIPETNFRELNIPAVPDWLQYYKKDTGSIERLYRWGFMYNGWDECAKALTYLEKAEKINPAYKGLAVELAFSYNCLEQYDKAEAILAEEIKINATDAYVCKEYIYTLTKNNKAGKAIEQFERTLKTIEDDPYKAENCYNILECFYYQKDKANFNIWYKNLQKYPTDNKMISRYADNMKADINK